MQDLPVLVKRHLALFLDTQSFVRLASTCREYRQLFSEPHYYYRARVRYLTSFNPIPEDPLLEDYKKVFETIHRLYNYEDRYFQLSEPLNRLVLQTPFILNKIISSKGGLEEILLIIHYHHRLHPLVFQNSLLIQQFKGSSDHWLTPFINIISDNKELFYRFLDSNLMIDALAYCQSIGPQTKNYLCRVLEEEYGAEEKYLRPVRELTYTDMRDAISRLLHSLKPPADDVYTYDHDLEVLYASPRASKLRMKQKQKEDAALDLNNMLNPATKTNPHQSLFHLAVLNQETERVRFFAQSTCIETPNCDGDFPIHIAATWGMSKLVKILASNPQHRDRINKEGNTALHVACVVENLEIVRILLDAGSDFFAKNLIGETPMSILKSYGHHELIELYKANKENTASSNSRDFG